MVQPRQRQHERYSGLVDLAHDLVALADSEGENLLGEDVLARAGRGADDVGVDVGGRVDDHAVDVGAGEDVGEVVVEGDVQLVGLGPAPRRVLVPGGHERGPGVLLGLAGVPTGMDVPEAEHGETKH